MSTILALPLLAVGAPLMLLVVRPWSRGRWWLFWAVLVGVLVWFLAILLGPSLVAGNLATLAVPW